LLTKEERIRFPSGSYQALHKGICYKIDPENDTVEMTKRLSLRYSPESKDEAVNRVNKLGAERIQKRVSLFSKLLIGSILFFLFLTLFPFFFSAKSENVLSWGKFITLISEISFLYMFGCCNVTMNYYKDSHCEKCGKYFVFEEFQAPLLKEISKTNAYIQTLTKYWHCKNCGYEDIKVESQHIAHNYGMKQPNTEEDKCEECGREHAIEEYRNVDILNSVVRKKIRYFKCKYCSYHEIRLRKKILNL
jgi:hypothetical protein